MMSSRKSSLAALMLAGVAWPALAADLPEPTVVEPPTPVEYAPAQAFGGWYIRGDVDYHWTHFRGADYDTYNTAKGLKVEHGNDLDGDINGAWSVGGGVGYKINDYLRTDLTADYFADTDFNGHTTGLCAGVACTTDDHAELSTWLLLANAYADFYTYKGVTFYGGAGIGGAHVKWDTLKNDDNNGFVQDHDGHSEWRFAYALMAGASYCLTNNLDLDVGYRFSRIQGGKMFDYARNEADLTSVGAGPGYDKGFNVHEVRAGLRYNFGGSGHREGCGEPVAYEPPPAEPVYK